ncbi:hypothetical protein H6S82_18335 [Planktothrix sp. FACHB-1355]|uniref:Uncharacterized protein n=1 Tax=Aerosakkonema funiforme FACHB-1375 TaxID=2949571 RepID=A0A926ZIZ3_9CYAN|nr:MULTISPECIES: hypothetical protein [Oscillatoriales]MBD2183772.1 hypothetical protein [Aerosakkonema funiforme FACHB-1375]MBD3560790.1 hypothetical protein [Planktothrix sp. FACHB-1355]
MRLTCDPPRPTHFVLKFIVSALAIATAAAPKTSLAQQTLAPERDVALVFCSLSQQNSCASLDWFADNIFAQTPEIPDVQASSPQTGTPSLQTEPSASQEKPFVPQNLPLVPSSTLLAPSRYGIAPNISVITPTAYGKSWGSISVGLGLQPRTRFTNEADGVLGVGFGLGDGRKAVGVDIGVSIADLDTAEDGSISFKLHRQLPDDFAVAVGVLNAIDWGLTDSGTSVYGVVTKRFRLRDRVDRPFSQLYVSAGVGSGQFRSESNINKDANSVGFFSSVAVRVAEPVNLIAEWSGQDLTIGLSVLPFRNIPLVVTPGVTDITGSAGDGSRFILGVGYLISF